MDYKTLDNILSDAVNNAELCCDDIPNISLYLDQIVHLISDRSHEGSPRFYDRTLTKTMVNNYSKAGLITPVSGKKYTKEQIVQMLMINSLKNTLSISEIKGALDAFYACEGTDSTSLMQTYDKYVDMRRISKVSCPEIVKEMIERNGFDIENDVEYFNAILGVVAIADYFNCISHAMLEAILPQKPTDESDLEEAIKENAKEVKKGAKAVKKEVKRENKAQKKAEKAEKSAKSDANEKAPAHPKAETVIEDELSALETAVERALSADTVAAEV